MDDKKDDKKTTIDDWMVRISFAEAGEADMGFKTTGLDVARKTKLAMDKIMVVKSEKMTGEQERERKDVMMLEELEGKKKPAGEKLHVMLLDDEPIVGKRLKPALTKYGFEVEVFEEETTARAEASEKELSPVAAGAALGSSAVGAKGEDLGKALASLSTDLASLQAQPAGTEPVAKADEAEWPLDLNSRVFREGVRKAEDDPTWGFDPGRERPRA